MAMTPAHRSPHYRVLFCAATLLLKRMETPAGSRWITVHPHGPGSKGQPILVIPHPKKKGAWSVIGGAGGKLNYLKIRGLKDQQTYKEEARERQAGQRAAERQRIERDREAGIFTPKTEQKKAITAQRQTARRAFVEEVARMAGWDAEKIEFPAQQYQHLSPKAYQAMQVKHEAIVLKAAKKFVNQQRQVLLADTDRHAELQGAVSLTTAHADQISVADLNPVRPPDAGLGFTPAYRERAEEQAGGQDELAVEMQQQKEARAEQRPPADPAHADAAASRREQAEQLRHELEQQRPPPSPRTPEHVTLQTDQIMQLLRADKQMRAVEQQARDASRQIDAATKIDDIKAYNLTLGDRPDDIDIVQDLQDQLRTAQTRSFLSAVGQAGEDADLDRHLGVGASAAANAVGLTLTGTALIDRSVVDVLGMEGAARAMAQALHANLTPEDLEDAISAIEDYHVDHYTKRAQEAMEQAKAWQDAASGIEIEDGETGHDLALLQFMNQQKVQALAEARKVLGTTLGEFEMNAALIMALKQGVTDKPLETSLGAIDTEAATLQLRALGLEPDDFTLDTIGGQQFATVSPAGLSRIAKPVDRQALDRERTAMDIITGQKDEADWLPAGVARRPDLAAPTPPGVAPTLAEPFSPDQADSLTTALEDYIGGRTADGDAPADILADVLSLTQMQKAEAAGHSKDDYMAVVNAIAPSRDDKNKLIRAEAHTEKFQALADQFVQRRHGGARSPLHRQDLPLDDTAVEVLHRALADQPAGVAAFKPIGELDRDDQRTLRKFFEAHVAKNDPNAAPLREELDKLTAHEPEKEMEDMFGEVSVNPAWYDWQNRRNELTEQINAATLDWGKYVKMMHGRKNAYAATQDLIKSQIAERVHHHYNVLRPTVPLKLGRQVIRGNLNHLDAIDPDAREARLSQERKLIDSLRNRAGGKYAAGSVAEKMDATREQREAAAQSQMGFFGAEELPADDSPLKTDERHTLGHVAEQRLAQIAYQVGKNFKPDQPVKLWDASMSGKYINQQRAVKLIEENKRVALAQGVGCVDGGTILDDADGRQWTFYQWWLSGECPTVRAINKDGKEVYQIASPVFIKGLDPMYHVQLENGASIIVTGEHQFLTPDGWQKTKDLTSGAILRAQSATPLYPLPSVADALIAHEPADDVRPSMACDAECFAKLIDEFFPYHPESIAGNVQSIRRAGGLNYWNKAQDYLDDYFADCYQDDAPPLTEAVDAPIFAPSRSDALEYSHYYLNPDDLGDAAGYSHAYPQSAHHSKHDFYRHAERHDDAEECCIFSYTSSPLLETHLNDLKSQTYLDFARDIKTERLLDQGGVGRKLVFWQPNLIPAPHSQLFDDSRLFQRQSLQSIDSEKKPQQFADDRISWQKISSITSVGSRIVFDLHVPINHCYFANGILNHNSGKSIIGLGAFTHLHAQGKVKRGIFAVPSIVQQQFGGEALRYLEPGKYQWHAEPGASREERIAALKDPANHFVVTTHQSLRDDLLHLGAQREGITHDQLADRLDSQTPQERTAWMKDLMAHEGIDADYLMVDEGHSLLNREGKENSRMANVLDALSGQASYYVNATADPIKNDASEAFSLLQKLDPEKYQDQAAFMRQYGVNTSAGKAGLRREMAKYLYPGRVDPGVAANKTEEKITLTDAQHQAIADLDRHVGQLKLSRLQGQPPDIAAAKAIAPAFFRDVPESEHPDIAKQVAQYAGALKRSATKAIIDRHPEGAKINRVSEIAAQRKTQGHPGIVFAHSLDAVKQLSERLAAEGHRVVTMTGADSSADKARKKAAFNPEHGEASADIMITSDAGAVGMNAQRGRWMVQYDSPDTAMIHSQRSGRIHRIGQKNNVDLIDLVADHPEEHAARKRLATKYELRELLIDPLDGLDDTGLAGFLSRQRAERNSDQGGLF